MTRFTKFLTALELLGMMFVLVVMAMCIAPGAFL